ncbi:MAG: cytotoxic translational repressor of toxin-antitoxin stability system [Syntrophales bacterium LBB04]|nr:cytotoxic translational repressor of toxin-antitoxin stability system [Syntrophales bacterium LBB04]
MPWTVIIDLKVKKKLDSYPRAVRRAYLNLHREIEMEGPVRGNWPNYGKLGPNRHHCHVKKGRPTYVAIWEVIQNEVRLVEVTYVGTHEKAPY